MVHKFCKCYLWQQCSLQCATTPNDTNNEIKRNNSFVKKTKILKLFLPDTCHSSSCQSSRRKLWKFPFYSKDIRGYNEEHSYRIFRKLTN